MSINPKTYEGVAYGLVEAGARVTYGVAEALTELHQKVIEDSDNLSRAADIYAKHIAEASARWEKDWRKWADEGLLEAYIQGVKHTDAELANLRKAGIRVHPPTEPIPEGAVMVKNLPTMTLPLDSPRWMKEAFVEIPNHLTAFNVFRRAAYFALEGTALQIIRKGNDLYRDVAIQAGSQMFREADIFTRRQFSQRMLDDFAKRGIQSITYSNGRKMSIEAYSEMVGRTMSGHAAVQGSLNRYAEHGYDLVRISAHFRACELCVPWEGKVLSTNGMNPDYESLDSAISAGLFHPNCFIDKQVKIFTSKGWRAIGDIQVGDLVLTHRGRFRKVTKLHRNQGRPRLVKIDVVGPSYGSRKGRISTLTLTEDHPVLVNGFWIPAKKVKPGLEIRMLAKPCKVCGKPTFLYRETCSDECATSIVTEKRVTPEYRKACVERSRKAILRQIAAGLVDGKARTKAANEKTREMVRQGVHPFQDPENHKKAQQSLGYLNYGKTWIEEKMGWYLTNCLGLEVKPQFAIPKDFDAWGRQRYYFADFLIAGTNIVIECDGSQWHSDKKADQIRQKRIEDQGYVVLRFTDSQIHGDLEECGKEIQRILANHNNEYLFMDVKVHSVHIQEPKRTYPLYNISVAEDESYIAKGFVVHNCAHDVSPYIPGLSPDLEVRVSKEEQALIDQYGYKKAQEIAYKAQVQQRYIERQIRSWKKRELTALDPTMKTQAHRKVLDWQKAQREHLTTNAFLPRKYERESVKGWATGRMVSGNPAENLANKLFARAQRVEPGITGIISRVASENNATLKGLEHRLKTRDSLARKIAAEYRDNVAASYKIIEKNLGDSIRYTYVIEESQYSKAVMKISEDLKARGLAPYDSKFRNYWSNPTYKGINSNWISQDGQLFEIQFHTPQSLQVKEEKSHKIYEKQRVETDPVKIKAYSEQIEEIWRDVRPPKDVDWLTIDGWKGGGWR